MGFFFLYSEHCSWGGRGAQTSNQILLLRGTPGFISDPRYPTRPWNWSSHSLCLVKCLSDKSWLLTFGVLFTWLVTSYSSLLAYKSKCLVFIFYPPFLAVCIWMLFRGPWLHVGHERLCALVFSFKTFTSFFCAFHMHRAIWSWKKFILIVCQWLFFHVIFIWPLSFQMTA